VRGGHDSGGLYIEVVYDEERWRILREKRASALEIMKTLVEYGFTPITYGSVARGDVHDSSDVEVFIPRPINAALLELIIERHLGGWIRREVVQATPRYVPKGYVYLDENRIVSFPLIEMLATENSFYDIAGKIDFGGLRGGTRVAGMNKGLMVVVPTPRGHAEFPAEKDIEQAGRLIGVDPTLIRRRVEVLRRRRLHGRTGVFRKITLGAGDSFSSILEALVDENPWIRKRLTI